MWCVSVYCPYVCACVCVYIVYMCVYCLYVCACVRFMYMTGSWLCGLWDDGVNVMLVFSCDMCHDWPVLHVSAL